MSQAHTKKRTEEKGYHDHARGGDRGFHNENHVMELPNQFCITEMLYKKHILSYELSSIYVSVGFINYVRVTGHGETKW